MALRRQHVSPASSLLRGSRLFALPNPLPRPPVTDNSSASAARVSETATLPFPTHQAIATTRSSLARGDWGLKRPIPSRSHIVQTSDPVLRINQLDTLEHITDYDSAADHVRTRQKWEELGIPMVKGNAAMRETGGFGILSSGAFERHSDTTSYDTDEGLNDATLMLESIKKSLIANAKENERARRADPNAPPVAFTPHGLPQVTAMRHNVKRWKHEGPWLPGMSADEFSRYITNQIGKRRQSFADYLRQYIRNEIYTTRQNAARHTENMPLDADEAEAFLAEQEKRWADISEDDVQAGIKALRQEVTEDPLNSKLVNRLVIPFLRLPSIKLKDLTYSQGIRSFSSRRYRFDDDTAPLSTHPSAGLGYLRTNAYLTNHPVLGPQGERTPVQARVVQPRNTSQSTESYARLGVAGFVANDAERNTASSHALHRDRAATHNVDVFDHRTPGGAKIHVLPRYASVTNDGRVQIKLARALGAEVLVAQGKLDDAPPIRRNVRPEPLTNLGFGGGSSGGAAGGGGGGGGGKDDGSAGSEGAGKMAGGQQGTSEAERVASVIRSLAEEHARMGDMPNLEERMAAAMARPPGGRRG